LAESEQIAPSSGQMPESFPDDYSSDDQTSNKKNKEGKQNLRNKWSNMQKHSSSLSGTNLQHKTSNFEISSKRKSELKLSVKPPVPASQNTKMYESKTKRKPGLPMASRSTAGFSRTDTNKVNASISELSQAQASIQSSTK